MSRLSETISAAADRKNYSQAEMATLFDMSQQAVSELLRGNTASPRKWRRIAEVLEIDEDLMRDMMTEASKTEDMTGGPMARTVANALASFSQDFQSGLMPDARIGTTIPTNTRERMIPVLGEAVGGIDGEYSFNGHILDYVACPPSLANVSNAYAVYIDGESMYPRYKSGETVYVHPTKPARRGDDVIIQIRPASEELPPLGYVKEFVGWTTTELVLKQHNPAIDVRFAREVVVSVHPIILAGKY
ncbi:LexA family transcriptional regulator [Endobacterium cereale]|uniref:LexA family transcriptional regulator n=1 Tax=Endobacterium cereale TaxID=2663029 RepID=UPI002B46949D|nr:S24 family peptidase [Endobacterium cereale]MEB2845883.1 S24 family peptidase [Endobacterium cereale]